MIAVGGLSCRQNDPSGFLNRVSVALVASVLVVLEEWGTSYMLAWDSISSA